MLSTKSKCIPHKSLDNMASNVGMNRSGEGIKDNTETATTWMLGG